MIVVFIIIGIGIILSLLTPKTPPLIIDLEKPPVISVIHPPPLPITSIPSKNLEIIEQNYIEEKAPYDQVGFGIDSHRNTDNYELQDYLELPLVGTGETYFNSHLTDINKVEQEPLEKYKYLRFTVLETKGNTETTANIRFQGIKDSDINIWNPYTGEKSPYNGVWTDNDTKSVIFYFPKLLHFTGYIIKTSTENSVKDPAYWTLEGSINASYWVELDSQIYELPERRGVETFFEI